MFRKTVLALLAILGAASAQKTKTFSVCTAPYNATIGGATSAGAAQLFTCNGNLPTTTAVGSFSYICGIPTTATGQSNQAHCSSTWLINGCAITQHGVYDTNLQPINPGTWVTSAGNGIKNCPKATSLTNLASVFTPSGGLTAERYTFTYKGAAKTPVVGP